MHFLLALQVRNSFFLCRTRSLDLENFSFIDSKSYEASVKSKVKIVFRYLVPDNVCQLLNLDVA